MTKHYASEAFVGCNNPLGGGVPSGASIESLAAIVGMRGAPGRD